MADPIYDQPQPVTYGHSMILASALGDWLYANGVAAIALVLAAVGLVTGTVQPRLERRRRSGIASIELRWEVFVIGDVAHRRLVLVNHGPASADNVSIEWTMLVDDPVFEETTGLAGPEELFAPGSGRVVAGQALHLPFHDRALPDGAYLEVLARWVDERGPHDEPWHLSMHYVT